jgi:hypothetical protein
VPRLCKSFTLAFALQKRKKHGKISVRVAIHKHKIKIFYYINPNKAHKSQSLFNLTTAIRVSGVTVTHIQEHKTTVSTASGNRYTVLFSAAIVEELEIKLHRFFYIYIYLHRAFSNRKFLY